MESALKQLSQRLMQPNVSCLFGYGSAVFPQVGSRMANNMVDFVVVTDDSTAWHTENLARNPRDYSVLKYLGAKRIAQFQENLNAFAFCNTMVKEGDQLLKYSVIQTKQFENDLLDWETLYMSGRLHKPVLMLKEPTNSLGKAVELNRRNALHAALLLLPDSFSLHELFLKISSLSYAGDFRMYLGEDRNKIRNIVDANSDRFAQLYSPLLLEMAFLNQQGQHLTQDTSDSAVYHHLECLPKNVLWKLQDRVYRKDSRMRDLEEVIFNLAHTREYPQLVEAVVREIAFASSICQTAKNFVSAGLVKSVVYAGRKMKKMLKSLKNR